MFLGSNIKLLRTRLGIKQEDLANDLDITRSTINNYENVAVLNPT
jgi:transcriptional regulator with XRE-family HTH domain